MIRDRLVVGIRNQALSQQLQMDPELTLERAKKRIRQQEAVKDQQRQLTNREETQLDDVRFRGRQPKLRPDRGDRRGTYAGKARNGAVGGRQAGKPCGRCGKGALKRSAQRRMLSATNVGKRDTMAPSASPRTSRS